ncbi:unnamed protein product [Amoebophrya sp. A120]|nr:unnamed protein product [Amoebophrya sp. A120]|eukprot:GSA120T00010793001.1
MLSAVRKFLLLIQASASNILVLCPEHARAASATMKNPDTSSGATSGPAESQSVALANATEVVEPNKRPPAVLLIATSAKISGADEDVDDSTEKQSQSSTTSEQQDLAQLLLTSSTPAEDSDNRARTDEEVEEKIKIVEEDGRWIWWLVVIYIFYAQVSVTDEWLVPAIEVVVEEFDIPEDVAGATLLALGCNGPELITNLVSLFLIPSDVGVTQVVGTQVFNLLAIVAAAVYACPEMPLELSVVSFRRDCGFYALSIVLLAYLFFKGEVGAVDSGVLLSCAILYAVCVGSTAYFFPEDDTTEEDDNAELEEEILNAGSRTASAEGPASAGGDQLGGLEQFRAKQLSKITEINEQLTSSAPFIPGSFDTLVLAPTLSQDVSGALAVVPGAAGGTNEDSAFNYFALGTTSNANAGSAANNNSAASARAGERAGVTTTATDVQQEKEAKFKELFDRQELNSKDDSRQGSFIQASVDSSIEDPVTFAQNRQESANRPGLSDIDNLFGIAASPEQKQSEIFTEQDKENKPPLVPAAAVGEQIIAQTNSSSPPLGGAFSTLQLPSIRRSSVKNSPLPQLPLSRASRTSTYSSQPAAGLQQAPSERTTAATVAPLTAPLLFGSSSQSTADSKSNYSNTLYLRPPPSSIGGATSGGSTDSSPLQRAKHVVASPEFGQESLMQQVPPKMLRDGAEVARVRVKVIRRNRMIDSHDSRFHDHLLVRKDGKIFITGLQLKLKSQMDQNNKWTGGPAHFDKPFLAQNGTRPGGVWKQDNATGVIQRRSPSLPASSRKDSDDIPDMPRIEAYQASGGGDHVAMLHHTSTYPGAANGISVPFEVAAKQENQGFYNLKEKQLSQSAESSDGTMRSSIGTATEGGMLYQALAGTGGGQQRQSNKVTKHHPLQQPLLQKQLSGGFSRTSTEQSNYGGNKNLSTAAINNVQPYNRYNQTAPPPEQFFPGAEKISPNTERNNNHNQAGSQSPKKQAKKYTKTYARHQTTGVSSDDIICLKDADPSSRKVQVQVRGSYGEKVVLVLEFARFEDKERLIRDLLPVECELEEQAKLRRTQMTFGIGGQIGGPGSITTTTPGQQLQGAGQFVGGAGGSAPSEHDVHLGSTSARIEMTAQQPLPARPSQTQGTSGGPFKYNLPIYMQQGPNLATSGTTASSDDGNYYNRPGSSSQLARRQQITTSGTTTAGSGDNFLSLEEKSRYNNGTTTYKMNSNSRPAHAPPERIQVLSGYRNNNPPVVPILRSSIASSTESSPQMLPRVASTKLRRRASVMSNDALMDLTNDLQEETIGTARKLLLVFEAPINFLYDITMSWCDPKETSRQHRWYWCFLLSMLWLGIFSNLMVSTVQHLAKAYQIPVGFLGATLCAAGTSLPNVWASFLASKDGKSNMAIANALGSNVQNAFVALALPWFLKCYVFASSGSVVTIPLRSPGLECGTIWMAGTLLLLVGWAAVREYTLDSNTTTVFAVLYVVFVLNLWFVTKDAKYA